MTSSTASHSPCPDPLGSLFARLNRSRAPRRGRRGAQTAGAERTPVRVTRVPIRSGVIPSSSSSSRDATRSHSRRSYSRNTSRAPWFLRTMAWRSASRPGAWRSETGCVPRSAPSESPVPSMQPRPSAVARPMSPIHLRRRAFARISARGGRATVGLRDGQHQHRSAEEAGGPFEQVAHAGVSRIFGTVHRGRLLAGAADECVRHRDGPAQPALPIAERGRSRLQGR